jgi:hypothetical protein
MQVAKCYRYGRLMRIISKENAPINCLKNNELDKLGKNNCIIIGGLMGFKSYNLHTRTNMQECSL